MCSRNIHARVYHRTSAAAPVIRRYINYTVIYSVLSYFPARVASSSRQSVIHAEVPRVRYTYVSVNALRKRATVEEMKALERIKVPR